MNKHQEKRKKQAVRRKLPNHRTNVLAQYTTNTLYDLFWYSYLPAHFVYILMGVSVYVLLVPARTLVVMIELLLIFFLAEIEKLTRNKRVAIMHSFTYTVACQQENKKKNLHSINWICYFNATACYIDSNSFYFFTCIHFRPAHHNGNEQRAIYRIFYVVICSKNIQLETWHQNQKKLYATSKSKPKNRKHKPEHIAHTLTHETAQKQPNYVWM